jgi:hypothetical protein
MIRQSAVGSQQFSIKEGFVLSTVDCRLST